MRLVATGLLVAMAALFLVSGRLAPDHVWAGYVQAFAEAAMVGGLADWFAVTALFRHPLGVPIPHTAIIPRNKDRIGDSLAAFLRSNFLTPRVVAKRLERVDIAAAAGRWLQRGPADGRLRRGLGRLVEQLFAALDHEAIGGMIRNAAVNRLRATDVSPMLGRLLASAVAEGRHHPLVDGGIGWAAATLDSHESLIRDMVRERTAWVLRLASIDATLSDRIIDALRRLLIEMAADPDHPLRGRIDRGLADFAFDLQFVPETRAEVERIKQDLIASPAIAATLDGLWAQARAAILSALNAPDSATAGRLAELGRQIGATLEADATLRAAINAYARRAIVGAVADYGDAIVSIVSDTVRGWDARTVSDRLENAVGRDLQYIRINGTLIGGLVGLVIHAATHAL